MDGRATRCIECGGFVDSLNEDDDGEPCPACAERLLETLPGVFHRPWMQPWDADPVDHDVEIDAFLAEDPDRDGSDESPTFRPLDDRDPFEGPDRPA